MDIGTEEEEYRIVKETTPERAPVELPDPAQNPAQPVTVPAGS